LCGGDLEDPSDEERNFAFYLSQAICGEHSFCVDPYLTHPVSTLVFFLVAGGVGILPPHLFFLTENSAQRRFSVPLEGQSSCERCKCLAWFFPLPPVRVSAIDVPTCFLEESLPPPYAYFSVFSLLSLRIKENIFPLCFVEREVALFLFFAASLLIFSCLQASSNRGTDKKGGFVFSFPSSPSSIQPFLKLKTDACWLPVSVFPILPPRLFVTSRRRRLFFSRFPALLKTGPRELPVFLSFFSSQSSCC